MTALNPIQAGQRCGECGWRGEFVERSRAGEPRLVCPNCGVPA